MTKSDIHDDIDQLAIEVEQEIATNREFIDGLPEYAPRSDRSKKLQRALDGAKIPKEDSVGFHE